MWTFWCRRDAQNSSGWGGGSSSWEKWAFSFRTCFPPTPGLLLPPLISDMARRPGPASVTYKDFGREKINLTQIPLLPAASPPPPFLPHYFFPFPTSFLGLLSGRKPTPLSSLTRDEMTRPLKFLGRTSRPLLRSLSPSSPLCHL